MKNLLFILTLIFAIIGALLIGSVVESNGGNGLIAAGVWFAGCIAVSVGMKKEPVLFMACGLVSAHQLTSCTTKPRVGTEVTLLLGNRQHITSLGLASGNNYIVESITMSGVTKFYKFQGLKQSNNFETSLARLKFYNGWVHGGSFIIFDKTGTTLKQVTDEIAPGDFVAIVEIKDKGPAGNSAFHMHGAGVGLVATEIKMIYNDAETGGCWSIKLGPEEGEYESNPPLSVWVTDLAATRTMLAGVTAA